MKKYINLIEQQLSSYNFGNRPPELYEPIHYILSLGGKRIRPVLTLMSCELFDDEIEKALMPAIGVEVFHNFTLLHDDIMDNAPLRRGKKTVHEKWDDNAAILSGDVMLVKAYELFLNYKQNNLQKILLKFNACAAEVCEGQQYDMNFETRNEVSEEEYLEMIRLKTAVLLGFSIELGAIIGGAQDSLSTELYEFGINIGLGFQLKDDLLDAFGNADKFGKQVGGDILANKKTYLLIKALELAKGELKDELNFWLKKKMFEPGEKVNAVLNIYNKLGIKKLSETKMNDYFDRGIKLLEDLDIKHEKKKPLMDLTLKLIDREN